MATGQSHHGQIAIDETDPLLGRVVNDRYKITAAIGHGGMGRVYKALQSPLDRVVALKVLGAGHDRDPNFYKRFFLEASVTAKLTHPNTITLFDYGKTDDGIFYIAMEYLTGRTLSQVMQAEGPLAQERVIHIAQQICRSLREAHALGIIHRDMKPANVMLMKQHDDHDFVKVLDFGLVKFFSGDKPGDEDITNAGTFMGSPHYIAPEQARNQNPDQRCDIYSLGVLLYHMLTGKVPFTAPNPVDIILKHLHDKPVPPRELRRDLNIDPQLETIVLRCMEKARENRYQTMDELLAALKGVRASLTGTSGPHSIPPPSDSSTLTPPSLLTPSGPMATMPTPAHGMARPPPPPPDDESQPAQAVSRPMRVPAAPSFAAVAEQKSNGGPALIVAVLVVAAGAGAFFFFRGGSSSTASAEAPAGAVAPVAASTPAGAPPVAPSAQQQAYPTASANTTIVSVTSTPAGAAVHDEDDRFLGLTPFELRVPTGKSLALTLKHDGYKPSPVKQKVTGERLPISVSLKKDKSAEKADSPQQGKRSVGYKDDPY